MTNDRWELRGVLAASRASVIDRLCGGIKAYVRKSKVMDLLLNRHDWSSTMTRS
jgi:hypothetical protein